MTQYFSHCLLCNKTDFTPVYPNTHPDLVQCIGCKFVFFKRIPTTEELINNYNNYPRHDAISPLTIKRYHELLGQFEKYRKTNNVIDVGCGNGHLLAEAKKLNWNSYGTEFTDNAVEICQKKGISMQQGVLNLSKYDPSSFDCLFFIEVIEHINNPAEELEKFRTLLRNGGVLYITTPNFSSFSSKYLKDNWTCVEYPEHLSYYTPSTLDKTLTKAGFKKESLITSGLSITSFKPKAKIQGSISENNESVRQMTETNFIFSTVKKAINFSLNLTNMGDTIKAVYTKN